MQEKGQAYSVFKLLIAAIVAMAILGILVPIIMQVMGIITKDPIAETKTLISDLVNNPGTLRHTDAVTFQPNTALSADSLVEKTPLSPEQVCFSKGAFEDTEFFQEIGSPVDKLLYTGGSDRTVKIAVLCQRGLGKLEEDMDAYATAQDAEYLRAALLESCECAEATQTCCAVILERT